MGCLYATAAAILVAIGVIGFRGIIISGLCDTSCPSDTAVAVYTAMFWGAATALLALTLTALIRWWRRR